ncbi:MAG: DNA cytosine methyltransferase [Limisphaerales bacterium]
MARDGFPYFTGLHFSFPPTIIDPRLPFDTLGPPSSGFSFQLFPFSSSCAPTSFPVSFNSSIVSPRPVTPEGGTMPTAPFSTGHSCPKSLHIHECSHSRLGRGRRQGHPFAKPGSSQMKRLTCIDLFCGCGGFTLGMERAGFSTLAAVDSNQEAVTVFRRNFPGVAHVFHKDLTGFPPVEMAQIIGAEEVDVIVGGPPCQGFSTVRQRDGSNSGPRMVQDKRRHLYRDFLRYVGFFKPKVFVMENVLGIKSAAGGKFFTKVQKEARAMGYRVHGQVERAAKLGVPQKRQRQLIIGTRSVIPRSTEAKPCGQSRKT